MSEILIFPPKHAKLYKFLPKQDPNFIVLSHKGQKQSFLICHSYILFCLMWHHDPIHCPKSLQFHKYVRSLILNMLSCPRCGTGNSNSACILHNIAEVQVYCGMHNEAYCQQNAVMKRCPQDLVQPLINNKFFNNKLGHFIDGQCICSYNKYITWHAIPVTFIINTIQIGKLQCTSSEFILIQIYIFCMCFAWP